MKRLLLVLGLAGCAISTAPLLVQDSVPRGHDEFTSLAVAALLVLVLIPVLANKHQP